MASSSSQDLLTMSHAKAELTGLEKFQLATTLLVFGIKGIATFLVTLVRRRDFRMKTIRRTLFTCVSRNFTSLSLRQSRSIQQPTGLTIDASCSSKHLEHSFIHLEAGEFPEATLHFIGRNNTGLGDRPGRTLLFFHGGGYIFPMSSSHFDFACLAAEAADASLVILEYTLAPQLQYPGQLAQAVSALRFLLKQHHASQIIVGGDSAGGNMTLALLSHMKNPHPHIPHIFCEDESQNQNLLAAFCISPRCSNICTTASWKTNSSKDIVGHKSMELFNSNWKPEATEIWATPICGDLNFWAKVQAHRVLVVAGADEVYVDDIKRVAEMMGAEERSGAEVQLVVCPGEIHDQIILDMGLGIGDGLMLSSVLGWLRSLSN